MPAILTNRIYRGWKRKESYWDSPGMDENLKVISDHLPGLRVLGLDISPLPGTAAEGDTVLHVATGKYSVYSLKADTSHSGWETYPASKGMLALFNNQVYGSDGSSWSVVGSGSGSGSGSGVVTNLGSFTMDNTTAPSGGFGRKFYADTVPGGYNIGAGRMSFSTDIVFNNYFAVNPDGHMAVVLRQDPALAETAVRGNGMAIGNLTGAPEGTQVNPGAQVELWANSVNPQENRLVPGAESGEALQDGVPYKLLVESSVAPDGNKYARMAIYKQTARGHDCVVDTGDVLDTLVGSDFTKAGLLIGHVFGANVSGWSIAFTNMKVWWGAFAAKNTDTSYGGSGGGGSIASVANTAFSNATTFKAIPVGAARAWHTVVMGDAKNNSSFGTWDAAGSVFTFTKAGGYEFNVNGLLGGLCDNAGGVVKVAASVYADFTSFQQWVGRLDSTIVSGSSQSFATAVTGTVRVPNVAVGDTFKLVAVVDPMPGLTNMQFGWGVAGGVAPDGTSPAGSGVIITAY
jgi:hypothetical protein